jgi:Zn-dependent protease/CBS domain-containing protein
VARRSLGFATMNGRGVRVGRISGIEIAIDASWVFIVVLLTWSLTVSFAHWHPTWGYGLSIAIAFIAALLFFASVVVHELAHSLVARRFGVPVRRIVLFLFGGVSNIEREPPSPGAEFLTAIVGPVASIALGVVLLVIGSLATHTSTGFVADPGRHMAELGPGETILMWLGPINILVGVFNLIPGFPLDGGRIFRSIVWAATRDLHVATRWASGVGQAVGWGFVFLGIAMALGAEVPFFGRGLGAGLWLAFIGWFLSSAAAQSWRQQLLHEVLDGVPVRRVMRPLHRPLDPNATLEMFVNDWLLGGDERASPVIDTAGRFVGIATLDDVRAVPREQWPTTRVGEAMVPAQRVVTTSPREDLGPALEKMSRADVSQLPVLEDGQVVAMLLRSDVGRWIELHAQPPMRRYAR